MDLLDCHSSRLRFEAYIADLIRGDWPSRPSGPAARLLHRAAAPWRAQERRADGGADRAPPHRAETPVVAEFSRERPLISRMRLVLSTVRQAALPKIEAFGRIEAPVPEPRSHAPVPVRDHPEGAAPGHHS